MRRLVTLILSLGLLCAAANLYAATLNKEEKTAVTPASVLSAKVAKMRAAGVVIEISETSLKIERKVKDKVEPMEFLLEKPLSSFKVGDKVKVSYINREEKNVATKVTADLPQKVDKKANSLEINALPVPVNR